MTGGRVGPPEDSGGPWGFAEPMRSLSDEKHPEYEMHSHWMDQIGETGTLRYSPRSTKP